MDNISIFFAFTAGMLSFFSPCIFPLIPAYIANLTGSTVQSEKIVVPKRVLMSRSIYFILGFSLVFMLMGASASVLGQLFAEYRGILEKVSGFLIIVFGMQMAGFLSLRFLMFEKRFEVDVSRKKNNGTSFLMGLAFGTGWTPCVGLALSSILLLAGSVDTMYSGLLLLLVYSLGLGIPFLLISWMITYSLGAVRKVNKMLPRLSLINGWILISMGLLLFTGQLQKLSAWLATFTPFIY
ncbi:cytochrome c biogenesis CcdA family protein [Ammoniphilus sp. CFH 90114]|uniref:cytochrome c biogenesis CcdA family protein n=1 Tax=Ammoniphilus sp. CFH 90114 TaxID=2493665 RepID=UPI00100E9028|nr:cytochrome c biogenesis protein CcdA [Ammoniphilus sp. CFH 90114]RXT07931.1 cytochrome c biogenesis protein CcdA [Ammoniphilus sp. CFH 90114]